MNLLIKTRLKRFNLVKEKTQSGSVINVVGISTKNDS